MNFHDSESLQLSDPILSSSNVNQNVVLSHGYTSSHFAVPLWSDGSQVSLFFILYYDQQMHSLLFKKTPHLLH